MCLTPSYVIGHSFYLLAHLASVSAAQSAPAPSKVANSVRTYKAEQDKHPIYNGRPIELHGPPVEIYDETLAKLKHDLSDLSNAPEPSTEYIVQTANLFHASAPIYDSEALRTDAVNEPLKWLLGADIQLSPKASEERSNKLATDRDGAICETLEDVSCGKKAAVVAYLELKNELGLRGEAGLQAALSLRKYVSQKDVRLLITIDLPCDSLGNNHSTKKYEMYPVVPLLLYPLPGPFSTSLGPSSSKFSPSSLSQVTSIWAGTLSRSNRSSMWRRCSRPSHEQWSP